MKKIIYPLLILSIIGCKKNDFPIPQEKISIITGTINGYNPQIHDNQLMAYNNDIFYHKSYYEYIEDNGAFLIQFKKHFFTDCGLKYGKEFISVFIEPGDSTHIEFNVEEFFTARDDQSFRKNPIESLKFFGKNSSLNFNLNKYYPFLAKKRDTYEFLLKKEYFKDSLKFQASMDSLSQSYRTERVLLKKYVQLYHPGKAFVNWAENSIEYSYLCDLIEFLRAKRISGEITEVPDSYKKVISKSLDYRSNIVCSQYRFFLGKYFFAYYLAKERSQWNKASQKEPKSKIYDFVLKSSEKLTQPWIQDLYLTQTFIGMLDGGYIAEFEGYFTKYGKYISTENYKTIIEGYYQEYRNKEYTSIYDLIGQQADLLRTLANNNKGKYLYIDFWMTSCAPCIKEFEYSKEVQKRYGDKDVVFVYLCCHSKKDKWQSIVDQFDLEGEHFLLERNQSYYLQDIMGVQGFPHYSIVDPKGKIISKNAESPSYLLRSENNQLDQILNL